MTSSSAHTPAVYLLLFLIIVFIPSFVIKIVNTKEDLQRLSKATNFIYFNRSSFSVLNPLSSSNSDPTIEWNIPTIDPNIEIYQRDNQPTKDSLNYPFYRPLVYLYAARPCYKNESETELFLYGQGVRMGNFNRNLKVVGCLVGSKVFALTYFSNFDIFMCRIPHRIEKKQFLSIVIGNDDIVDRAIRKETIQIGYNLNVTLQDDDLVPISSDVEFDPAVDAKAGNSTKFYYVNSIVKFESEEQLLTDDERKEAVRYRVCGITQQKLYPALTEPWVDYHRRIGMDFIFIVDNNSTHNMQKQFEHRSDVHISYFPYSKSQLPIWSYYMIMAQTKCEWLFLFDPDEYLMFGLGKENEYAAKRPLQRFVNRLQFSDVVGSQIYYITLMGQHTRIPKDPPPMNYIYGKTGQRPHCKILLRMDFPWSFSTIHYAHSREGHFHRDKIYFTEGGMERKPIDVDEDPVLIHYQIRTWEEFILKKKSLSGATADTRGLGEPDTKLKLDSPPSWFKNPPGVEKYTHFRSLWKSVTEQADMDEQFLVTTRNGSRCVGVIAVTNKKVKSVTCTKLSSHKKPKL